MIKVTNTKVQHVHVGGKKPFDEWDDRPVAEGKLVLVECKREESVFYILQDKILPYFPKDQGPIKGIGKYYKPIIISETEKIEIGDWYLSTKDENKIRQLAVYQIDEVGFFKILALPEQFSPEQLQLIVEGVYKDGDKVLIECNKFYDDRDIIMCVEINTKGHCILYKGEEVKPDTSCTLGVGDGTGQHFVHGDYDSIKVLQAKLLKMEELYTKEEVMEIASNWAVYCRDTDFIEALTKQEWFEKNVK